MTAKQLEETLAAIATKAKALRDAGVVGRVTIGAVSFELGEVFQQPAAAPGPEPQVVNDPHTYGGHTPKRRAEYWPDDENEE